MEGIFCLKFAVKYLGIKVRLVFARMDSMGSRNKKKFYTSFSFAFNVVLSLYIASVKTSNACS